MAQHTPIRLILQKHCSVYDTVLGKSIAIIAVALILINSPVFFLQQLLWPDCLRIMDIIILQCPIHTPSPSRHRHL